MLKQEAPADWCNIDHWKSTSLWQLKELEKIVKINFFRPLEINQNPATIWRLSLSKNSEHCRILTLYYYPLFIVLWYPWRNKPIASQPMKREGWVENTSQSSISSGQLLLICLAAPLKSSIQGLLFIWPDLELPQQGKWYLHNVLPFCKINHQQVFHISSSWGGKTRWDKQEYSQNMKKENEWIRWPSATLKSYFWSHRHVQECVHVQRRPRRTQTSHLWLTLSFCTSQE